METFSGLTAIVTGAASGIGKGCAMAFAEAGASVVVTDINEVGARAVAREISDAGFNAIGLSCDVGRDGQFELVRDAALNTFGRIDLVMNNAGVILSGHPEDIPVSEWERVININLISMARSNAVFLPILLNQKSGHIVNTASFAGLMTYSFDRLPYAASKAAIVALSEGLALYLRPKGIGVTLLCPGPVKTDIMSSTKVWTEGVVVRGPGPEFDLLMPSQVGTMVVNAVLENRFFLPTHPDVRTNLMRRAADPDGQLEAQIAAPNLLPVQPLSRNAI